MQPQAKPLQPSQAHAAPAPSTQKTAIQAARAVLSAEQLLQLQAELLGRKRFNEAATAMAQQLASSLKCERASFGWQEKNGTSIVAASYVAEVHTRQETARLIAAAMEEAAEQGIRLVHPEPANGKPHILLAHEELARRQGYSICTVPLAYDGRNYNALDASDVALTNLDDDTSGITMTPASGLITDESGASDTFSVVLTSQPLADVVIDLSSSNTAEGTLSASSLTFTSGNWNIPQLVTVTGVNDVPNDGDIAYQAIAAPAVSADSGYNGLAAGAVDVTNLDVADPVAVDPTAEPVPPEAAPQPLPDDEAGAPESPADEQVDATPAAEGNDPGQPLVETAGTGEFARTNPVEAALNNGLKTSAPMLVNNETPRREVLTHPETQGGILLRVLEILQVEHTLADGNSHSLGSAIKVEINQDDNFQVEILSQGAQITAVSLSVGAVWRALRAGGLFTSLLTSLPAWRSFDMLPVLSRDEDDDDASWNFGDEPEDDDKNDDTRMPELTP